MVLHNIETHNNNLEYRKGVIIPCIEINTVSGRVVACILHHDYLDRKIDILDTNGETLINMFSSAMELFEDDTD